MPACHLHRGLYLTAVLASGTLEEGSSLWISPGFHCTWQMADSIGCVVLCCVDKQFADVRIEWPMIEVGLWYGEQTELHVIDDIFDGQRYHNKRPIFVLFIHKHQLMLQHDPTTCISSIITGHVKYSVCQVKLSFIVMFWMLWINETACSTYLQFSSVPGLK